MMGWWRGGEGVVVGGVMELGMGESVVEGLLGLLWGI